ncbi:Imm64 family immunity protein [Metabacillus indicus]|uniref:Imm64 family immunity protein n=1 Tax=Metabacillus indicus TaxID=246786 RepID=UPI002A0116B2|nr:Imm64 family immunity protein [Metabacillus indicus]MDX8290487.1 Imm64 family immunity protein [Metabacillus indicus]
MGGFFSIGIVYSGIMNVHRIEELIKYLKENYNACSLSLEYSMNENGEYWEETNQVITCTVERFSRSYYGIMNLKVVFLGLDGLNLMIEKIISKHFFGFLLCFRNDEIFLNKMDKEDIKISVINELIRMGESLDFSYAIAGLDAEIEYSPDEFNSFKHLHSLSIINNHDHYEIRHGEFQLDGISFQKEQVEVIMKST